MGDGYRIESLPGQPYQTKYPPLYPALLAGIWKLNPQFPANLVHSPRCSPGCCCRCSCGALWVLLREYGFSLRARYVMVLMAGLSPVTVVFSFSLMPELLFTALLIGERDPGRTRHEAGSAAVGWLSWPGFWRGLAYLTKSIAAPLLFTVPLCFALRKHFREGRAVLRRYAARGRGMAVVGCAAPDAFLGSGDAVLHQLRRASRSTTCRCAICRW